MFEELRVKDVYRKVTTDAVTVSPDASIEDVVRTFLANPMVRTISVVGKEGRLLGIITLKQVIMFVYPKGFLDRVEAQGYDISKIALSRKASQIMRPAVYVYASDPLSKAIMVTLDNDIRGMPVVDDDLNVIGDLKLIEILSAWKKVFME